MAPKYRPPRSPLQWSNVRELTLGEIADRTKRQAGYFGIVAAIVAVAAFFPGAIPITKQFTPSGGGFASGGNGGSTDVAGRQVERAALSADGDTFSGEGSFSDGSPFGPGSVGDDRSSPYSPTRAPSPAPDDAAACAPDEHSPEPFIGPTLDEVKAAQSALEEGIGRPFPVDLVGSFKDAVCGGGSASAMGNLLLLGRFVPRDDTGLLAVLAPVVAPACEQARGAALLEALVMRSVSPALLDALALCAGAAVAQLGAAPLPDEVSEAPSTAGPAGVSSPSAGAPAEPLTAPSWTSPVVFF